MRRSLLVSTLLLLFCCFTALAQNKKVVSGTVKDDKGTLLPGVTVLEKGTTNGTVSAPDGSFKISVSDNATLVVSFVGYAAQELPVAGQSNLSVSLASDSKGLNEVVVTAMGIKRETRALGYSVSTVSSKDLTKSGNTNFASALYGKAAGVKVVTPPGGASSAVSIQVRGVSSITGNTQPLYVVDGVPIRNFNSLTNPTFGTTNGRIDGNGALDINPEDIESLSILKGASASALYGSEATNGVVLITTKKGFKQKGLGVELNYGFQKENLAYSPDYQNEYGPGYDPYSNVSGGISDGNGWITEANGDVHPFYRSYEAFGPKFDGRTVRYWDGSYRKYVASENNYRDFYQNGYNSNLNLAVSQATDNGSFRVSYNRVDYKSILPGSKQNKNNFNFNGTLKLGKKVTVDLVSTYNNNFTHNRPYAMSNVFGAFNGFFSRMDNMDDYFNKFQTSDGYKYVAYNDFTRNQDEKLLYNIRATNLMDYLWTALRDSYDEKQNRFINSATVGVEILDNLKFRGRVGGDFTGWNATDMQHNTQPVGNGYSGKYQVDTRQNNIFYGDALLTYNPKISKDFDLGLTGGVSGRKQTYTATRTNTNGGLVTANWFSITNSANTIQAATERAYQTDVAAFGMLNLSYKGWLYAEGTIRHEGSSTLPAATNSYTYPSVNAGFVFSDVFKLPSFWNYGKLRAAYGIVGNHPNIYQANVSLTQYGVTYNNTNYLYQQPNANSFGNLNLQSEKKREFEVGLDSRFLNGKVTVDLSYYNNTVSNMILITSTAPSVGGTSALVNAGSLNNYGFEAAIGVTPIQTKDFTWNSRLNFALNRNKLTALAPGMDSYTENFEGGGYMIARANVGEMLGNIYVHPQRTDANGNKIVAEDGTYLLDNDKYVLAGNILPKVVGGWSNSFNYKNFTLDVTLDYRFGGKLVSIPTYYAYGAGFYKETLKYRDAARGGLGYNVVSDYNGQYTLAAAGATADRYDGMVLPGVTEKGETNTKVITAGYYYMNNFNWRTNGDYSKAIFNNNYIKLREVVLTYNLPKAFAEKIRFNNLSVSLVGRNLLYVYKSLPFGLDPEVAVGSRWLDQGIDNGTAGPTRSLGASLRARF